MPPSGSDPSPDNFGQLRGIWTNAVDAIITIDEKGNIHSANPATERLFGFAIEEIVGLNVKVLMPSPYQEEHDAYLAAYLDSGVKKIIGIGREVLGRRKDGTTFPMHLAVSEFQSGGIRMFTGVVRDVSDLKEAERRLSAMNDELEERVRLRTQELRAAQAELLKKERLATLGQVSGGIAHEIRNPLNAVKTSAFYLMNARNITEEKQREHLERIDRQVALIDNVVTALSDVAKLPEPEVVPTNIAECLKQVVSETSMPDVIDVQFDFTSDTDLVLVDRNQIPIAFRNLVRNARDAMLDGGQLIIRVSQAEDLVVVEVVDDGHGISEDDLKRITEPLYSTKARGMGLGLAITKAILDKNKATLHIASEIGAGSTFRVGLRPAVTTQ